MRIWIWKSFARSKILEYYIHAKASECDRRCLPDWKFPVTNSNFPQSQNVHFQLQVCFLVNIIISSTFSTLQFFFNRAKIQNCLHFHKRGSCKHPHLDKVSDSGRSHTIRNTVDQVIKNDKPRTSVAFSFPVCVSSVRVNTKTNWPKKKFVKISVAIFWEVFRSYFALRQM